MIFGYKVYDVVAWEMIDGTTMTGTVTEVGYSSLYVKRVDGTEVILTHPNILARLATQQEILASIKWFQTMGKQ